MLNLLIQWRNGSLRTSRLTLPTEGELELIPSKHPNTSPLSESIAVPDTVELSVEPVVPLIIVTLKIPQVMSASLAA